MKTAQWTAVARWAFQVPSTWQRNGLLGHAGETWDAAVNERVFLSIRALQRVEQVSARSVSLHTLANAGVYSFLNDQTSTNINSGR
jgi:hypothetical protein